jgi:lysozyme family protein
VDVADVRALKDHPELVADFYRREYWEPAGGPRLPWPLALLAMDGAVNHGPGPGVVLVQQALGVPADGKVGLHTAQAAATADIARVLTEYQARRGVLYAHVTVNRVAKLLAQGVGREQAIAQGEVFLLGWMRRLALLMAEARG